MQRGHAHSALSQAGESQSRSRSEGWTPDIGRVGAQRSASLNEREEEGERMGEREREGARGGVATH